MLKRLLDKNAIDLQEELITLRQAQTKFIMNKMNSQLKQTHQNRHIRRDIARIKTLLNQRGIKV